LEDDFEAPYKSKTKKPKKPRAKGCPARKDENRKAHIYVWVENRGKDWSHKWVGDECRYGLYDTTWYTYECIGCGHVNNRRYLWGAIPTNIYSVREGVIFRWKMN
jgi:hypothetical protein